MSKDSRPQVLYVDNGHQFTGILIEEDSRMTLNFIGPRRPYGRGKVEQLSGYQTGRESTDPYSAPDRDSHEG